MNAVRGDIAPVSHAFPGGPSVLAYPPAAIARGSLPIASLPPDPHPVTHLPVPRADGRTVREIIDATETDAWLLTHRGRLVAEEYPAAGGPEAAGRHPILSVSKSLVGTVVGALCDAGVLDVSSPVGRYVPELRRTGYAGASIRDLLDMRSGIDFAERYSGDDTDLARMRSAVAQGSESVHNVLLSLRQKSAHSGPFEYRSCETDALAWVCEAASGTPMPTLMSVLVWRKLGAESDATVSVDREATGLFDGGISATARDLARFGAVYLRDGLALPGARVVSASWVADTLAGAADSREAFRASPDDTRMPGGMYRNQFWLPYPGSDVLLCIGIYGQLIYLNRRADVVAVKLSSWPRAQDAGRLLATLHAFDAISDWLEPRR